jgi:hypothetical protein
MKCDNFPVCFIDSLEFQEIDNTMAKTSDRMVADRFEFNFLCSANINSLGTPILKKAPGRWGMAVLVD